MRARLRKARARIRGIAIEAVEMSCNVDGVGSAIVKPVHGHCDSLRGRKILIVQVKRAERRDGSTPIVKLARVPMLRNQTPHLLPMHVEMIVVACPKLLPC